MPSKKHWKRKHKVNGPPKRKKKRLGKNQDGRSSARLTIEDLTHDPVASTPSPAYLDPEAPKFGQAPTKKPPQDGRSWHNSSTSYLYPPTSPNTRPPSDTDGSCLVRKSSGLPEYEGAFAEPLAPMMAPGHDQQQQRNQPPPHHRPHQQPGSSQQRQNFNQNGASVNGEQLQRNQHARDRDTERDQPQRKNNGALLGNRPMSSHIQVAKPYVFYQAIEGCLKDVGVAQAREDKIRLAGVQWIDDVRRALKLPVRTFDTAVVYYHKFRLVHSDGEYSFVDAAAAALFAACKIEDTLKKSRDILCAAHNLKVPKNEQLSPDDPAFEHHSRSIIGLERLMLEASSFDFRNRHPQTLMIKLAKHYDLGSPKTSALVKTAYSISLDLYRTFAPLKQSTSTLAFACLELAARLHNETENQDNQGVQAIVQGDEYSRWGISRAEVMETLLDLLELYTHYRGSTTVGPDFPLDTFLEVRIPLNEELSASNLPRFTEYVDTGRTGVDPAGYAATVNGVSAALSAPNGAAAGKSDKSPTSPSSATGGKANGVRQKAGERGREGTVRFMLNPDRERQERLVVAEYHPQPPQQEGQRQVQGQVQVPRDSQTPSGPASHAPSGPQAQAQAQAHSHQHPNPPPHSQHSQPRSHPQPHPRHDNHPYHGPGPGSGRGRDRDRDNGPSYRHGPRPGSSTGRGEPMGSSGGDEDGRPPRRRD